MLRRQQERCTDLRNYSHANLGFIQTPLQQSFQLVFLPALNPTTTLLPDKWTGSSGVAQNTEPRQSRNAITCCFGLLSCRGFLLVGGPCLVADIYIYTYMCVHTYIHIYIYTYGMSVSICICIYVYTIVQGSDQGAPKKKCVWRRLEGETPNLQSHSLRSVGSCTANYSPNNFQYRSELYLSCMILVTISAMWDVNVSILNEAIDHPLFAKMLPGIWKPGPCPQRDLRSPCCTKAKGGRPWQMARRA